ncbi:MAG: hypothetical protein D8B54_07080 [Catonella sp.]|jgi:phage protein|nr:MAG: hypothetical protein D8B54_07080 [Catonella sp.]DAX58106.1 MAG TPA: head closure knob [Caudoviricetes sp.]
MAKINNVLSKSRGAIEWTYDKLLSVMEQTSYRKPNGATGTKFGPVQGKANIPCRVSAQSLNNANMAEANKLSMVEKLFCQPDIEIKAGSQLLIGDVKYTATNEPFVYPTHQEVVIERARWV